MNTKEQVYIDEIDDYSLEYIVIAMIHYMRRTNSKLDHAMKLFEVTEEEYNEVKIKYPIQ